MTKIHVLGAGTPTPTPSRFGSAFVLETGDDRIMVDCGPAATHKLVQAGLWPTEINHLFFTHHHFDHDIDYPCFLLCRWDQSTGEERRLEVYGPTLTERITEGILGEDGVFAHDWKARVNHPLSQQIHVNRGGTLPRPKPDVFAKDVGPGRIYSGSDWEVTAATAEHVQPYLDSLAYRIDTPGGSVVFSPDGQGSVWSEQVVHFDGAYARGEPYHCGMQDMALIAPDTILVIDVISKEGFPPRQIHAEGVPITVRKVSSHG